MLSDTDLSTRLAFATDIAHAAGRRLSGLRASGKWEDPKILGNVEVGEGAKVGAGSVVLTDVPAHTTVVGVPARVVGRAEVPEPAREMDHRLPDYEI